ncbi:hypothetical protein [Streptomyces sp. NPDC056707]|uniref:hypothetical protein n=1 Tax=Streptomyces sp. NPDC056707 TaxID=3345919 RepID=UPI00369D9BFF
MPAASQADGLLVALTRSVGADSAQPMTVDPSKYEKAMPIVAAHLAKIERAVYRNRASHAGQPFAAVLQTLVEALQD